MIVKDIFNGSFASYYEKVINRLSSPLYVNRWRRSLVRGALALKPEPEVVVDFCSGAGNVGEFLLQEVPECKLINCDISLKLLKMAKERMGSRAYNVCSDNRFFPLKGNSIDILFSSFCVRNSPQIELTVREAKRCLKKGGIWAVLDFFRVKERNFCTSANEAIFKSFMELNKFVSKENRKAIDYLFESIEKFMTVNEFKELLFEEGFEVAEVKNFMGGIASTVIGIKREV